MKYIIVFIVFLVPHYVVSQNYDLNYTNKINKHNRVAHDRFITFGLNMNISEPFLEDHFSGRFNLGYEFIPIKRLPINVETRFSLFFDACKDKNWLYENNYFSYNIFTPSIVIVPKYIYEISDDFSLFVDNEFSCGIPLGSVNYNQVKSSKINKRKILLAYGCNIGVRIHVDSFNADFKVGYTTFDIYNTVKRNKPQNYKQTIPHPNGDFNVSMAFLFPL